MVMRFLMLVVFMCVIGTATTFLLYSLTKNPWLSCFILATTTTLFTLENCALLSETERKDEEIELLKTMHSKTLLEKVQAAEMELAYLKRERERQRKLISELKMSGRRWRSGEF
jgi:hypothetical protein